MTKFAVKKEAFPLEDCFGFDIRPYASLLTFRGGERIIREGDNTHPLYFLASGRTKVTLTHANGRVTLTSFIEAPSFLGELELLEARELTNGVTAVTPCVCYQIDTARCEERLMNDTRFLRTLCVLLSRRNVSTGENYSKNQAYPLKVRLAQFILLSAQNGLYREKHTEASEHLGVTYRHFLYVLADFIKQGILEKSADGYRILDQTALEELAGDM